MRVRDLIRDLTEKDLDDEVKLNVSAKLYINDRTSVTIESEVDVEEVMPGNTPVLLAADLMINIEQKINIF